VGRSHGNEQLLVKWLEATIQSISTTTIIFLPKVNDLLRYTEPNTEAQTDSSENEVAPWSNNEIPF
jgi:hypothetical protein